MISLQIDKAHTFKVGETLYLRVIGIEERARGKWQLNVEDVTPLPGAEPTGYCCRGCGIIEEAAPDGGLPNQWVKKEFPEQAYFLCEECQTDFRYCRVCGCSEEDPCDGGCGWAEEDLCSACTEKKV
ncbi:MAG: hypothetical protein Q8O55_01335 [Dehalococcoidales bacterium]|nr:hypothetical protein [Dehalococcoidales bacterium]